MEQQKYKQNQKKTPTGIKIISILNYILAVFGILFAIAGIIGGIYFAISGGSMASQIFGFDSQPGTLGSEINSKAETFYTNFGFIALVVGIIFALLSIFMIIVGINMWKGKNWARISEIILIFLWTILWSIELFKENFLNLIMIIPALIVFFYLIFSNNVKNFFS
jgi:hypothetical protein